MAIASVPGLPCTRAHNENLNRAQTKINLTKFLHYRANLDLSKISPVEKYPLYGILKYILLPLTTHHNIQFIYEEEYIDVTENEEWFRRYRYDIPVLHLNGRLLMMHRVDEDKLRTALEELIQKNTS